MKVYTTPIINIVEVQQQTLLEGSGLYSTTASGNESLAKDADFIVEQETDEHNPRDFSIWEE